MLVLSVFVGGGWLQFLLGLGACWCLLVVVGGCWCLLVFVGVCWCLLVAVPARSGCCCRCCCWWLRSATIPSCSTLLTQLSHSQGVTAPMHSCMHSQDGLDLIYNSNRHRWQTLLAKVLRLAPSRPERGSLTILPFRSSSENSQSAAGLTRVLATSLMRWSQACNFGFNCQRNCCLA